MLDDGVNTNSISGELMLWRSVMLRALEDACGYFSGGIDPAQKEQEIAAARRWFGSRHFEIVCDLADMDPVTVMKHAAKCFAEVDAGRVPEQMEQAERYAECQRTRRRRGIKMKQTEPA